MTKQISMTFIIIGIALFFLYIAVLVYNNSILNSVNRSHFRNSFPYNFYSKFSIVTRVILYTMLVISALLTAIGNFLFFYSFSTSYMLIIGILFSLQILSLIFSNLIPLSNYKLHISLSASSFFLFILGSILFAFSSLIKGAYITGDQLSLPIQILVGFFGFVSLIMMFNPKLLDWFKMEKTEDNGTTYYVLPKFNFYAMYEWIFLLFSYIASFLFLLHMFIIA